MVKILLAGGGTLGSVSPLIAITQHLKNVRYFFVGTRKGLEKAFVQSCGIEYKSIISVKLRRYLSVHNVVDLFKFPFAIMQAAVIIQSVKPDIVLTSGGFVAVPIALATAWYRIPLFMHQQDIKVGLANRIIKRFSTVITTTFKEQVDYFKDCKVFHTGNPVRSLGPSHDELNTILILGGSQGARGMNQLLNQIIPSLAGHHHVIHILGKKNFDQRLQLKSNYTALKFLSKDYGQLIHEARLVISRAGMATLTELASAQKTTVVIPIPHSHQVSNAEFLAKKKAVVHIDQNTAPSILLKKINLLLDDDTKRIEIASNLQQLFIPDAAARYARLVEQYIYPPEKPVAYIVGIGGIGVSALAYYLLEHGYTVEGSDMRRSEVTKRLEERGVHIHYNQKSQNVPPVLDVLLYSDDVPYDNAEIQQAKNQGAPVFSYFEYLGKLSHAFKTVAISGTHGKTTTTALSGYMLDTAKIDPTVIVGSLVPQFDQRNFRLGRSKILVIEADEYRAHMLLLNPFVIILTNIEADHLDYYKTLENIQSHFQRFVDRLPADGILIKNAEDTILQTITARREITFGFHPQASLYATNLTVRHAQQFFDVYKDARKLGTFSIHLMGRHNVLNALAAICLGLEFRIPIRTMKKSFSSFTGCWRRLELVGHFQTIPVYSDYGHHPTAIKATLDAVKQLHPDKKIFLVYQPHSFHRTAALFSDFVHAFDSADTLVLTEIFDVVGRDSDRHISSKDLFTKIIGEQRYYAQTLQEAQRLIKRYISIHDVLLIMGAGDIDKIARLLTEKKHEYQ